MSDTVDAAVVRHARRRRLIWVAITSGIAVVVGILVGYATSRHSRHRTPVHTSTTVEAISLAFIGAGVLVVLGVLVFAYRTGRVRSGRNSALWALDRAQKRSVIRQARGQEPLDPDRRGIVLEAAHRLADQRWMVIVFGAATLIGVGQIVGRQGSLGQWFWLAYVAFTVLAAANSVRSVRLAQQFLRDQGLSPGSVPDATRGG